MSPNRTYHEIGEKYLFATKEESDQNAMKHYTKYSEEYAKRCEKDRAERRKGNKPKASPEAIKIISLEKENKSLRKALLELREYVNENIKN